MLQNLIGLIQTFRDIEFSYFSLLGFEPTTNRSFPPLRKFIVGVDIAMYDFTVKHGDINSLRHYIYSAKFCNPCSPIGILWFADMQVPCLNRAGTFVFLNNDIFKKNWYFFSPKFKFFSRLALNFWNFISPRNSILKFELVCEIFLKGVCGININIVWLKWHKQTTSIVRNRHAQNKNFLTNN